MHMSDKQQQNKFHRTGANLFMTKNNSINTAVSRNAPFNSTIQVEKPSFFGVGDSVSAYQT